MPLSRRQVSIWIWLFISALVFGRVEGAHLHLCFDGQEAPAAVHMADGDDHDGAHHLDSQHVDQDVELLGATLVKKSDSGHDLPPAFVTCLSLLVPTLSQPSARPRATAEPPGRRSLYFDSPTRGPPL